MAKELFDKVYWLAVDNKESLNFHGISSPHGGSYNSYLIKDEKITIVDLVNESYVNFFLASLSEICDPKDVSYIVLNHVENDHSGGFKRIIDVCVNAQVICSERLKLMLERMFQLDESIMSRITVVSDESSLSIGKSTLQFFMIPMVHWPESMMTYVKEKELLFTTDLFGTEYSHSGSFVDECKDDFFLETAHYFTMVLRPQVFSVKSALKKVDALTLRYLAPSHGPVYRKNIIEFIEKYKKLVFNPEKRKVSLFYATIWGTSRESAQYIADGLRKEGVEADIFDIEKSNWVEMMYSAMTSKTLVFSSLTLYGGYHPLFDALFSYLKLNRQKKKTCFAVGSYGWAENATKRFEDSMNDLGYCFKGAEQLQFGLKNKEDFNKLKGIITDIIQALDNEAH